MEDRNENVGHDKNRLNALAQSYVCHHGQREGREGRGVIDLISQESGKLLVLRVIQIVAILHTRSFFPRGLIWTYWWL